MLEPSICELELVKLTKDYDEHRVLYYDLTPCSGGTVLHTNSDLMYHLYVYANNYVKLYDNSLNYLGCYGVTVGTYDDSYNYEHYYLSSAYTPNLIGIYDNCSCTGRTDADIIQELPGDIRVFWYSGVTCDTNVPYAFSANTSPLPDTIIKITNGVNDYCLSAVSITYAQSVTYGYVSAFSSCTDCNFIAPSPTPTVTPSITPSTSIPPTPSITPTKTPCITCYEYSLTATTGGLVSWVNCAGDNDFTNSTPGEILLIQCARENSIVGNVNIEIVALCYNSCASPTPTPTQTKTPTVTPSITPTKTTTPTVTPTPGLSPSVTPTMTPTPSITPTKTVTPTPTSSPVTGPCTCYSLYNSTNETLDYSYSQCLTSTPISDTLGAFQTIYICSDDLPAVDIGIETNICTSPAGCSQDSDCTGCS